MFNFNDVTENWIFFRLNHCSTKSSCDVKHFAIFICKINTFAQGIGVIIVYKCCFFFFLISICFIELFHDRNIIRILDWHGNIFNWLSNFNGIITLFLPCLISIR